MTQHFYFLLILQPRGNPCQSGYCLNDGDCFYQATNDNAICTCRNGFTGSRCEVSPCESLDCPENSECVTANGGAVCRCSPGFAGKTLGVFFFFVYRNFARFCASWNFQIGKPVQQSDELGIFFMCELGRDCIANQEG